MQRAWEICPSSGRPRTHLAAKMPRVCRRRGRLFSATSTIWRPKPRKYPDLCAAANNSEHFWARIPVIAGRYVRVPVRFGEARGKLQKRGKLFVPRPRREGNRSIVGRGGMGAKPRPCVAAFALTHGGEH